MGKIEKGLIESKYGPLWSGEKQVEISGKSLGIKEVLRAMDLLAGDIVPIDMVKVGDQLFVVRYYDGDDRCVVALEIDERFRIVGELRAHVADWLEDTYHDLGRKAISPYELVSHLMDLYDIPY